jgi:sodium/pantothenate symporter
VVVAVSPWQASRYLMARNEHTVIRAACGASLALLFMYPVLMLSGAAINLGKSDIEPVDGAMIWAAQHLMPTPFGAMLMAGVMAAALSSATTFLSLVGFSASNDLMPAAVADEQDRLRTGRLCMLGIGMLVLLIALAVPPRIIWITYFAGTVFASSWGPVALMSVWSGRITADAAFWGIITGFIGNIGPKALDYLGMVDLPVWADPIIIGALLSTVVILLVSPRGTVTEAERSYRENLHKVPAAEQDPKDLATTRRWAGILMAGGTVLSTLMIVFWAVPYGSATGGDLISGELWVSIGYGSVLVTSGWAVRRYLSAW